MPIISGFYATTVINAFLLAGIISAISTVLTVEIRLRLQQDDFRLWSEFTKIAFTAISSLIITVIVYLIMYVTFGFGGGMLASGNSTPPLL